MDSFVCHKTTQATGVIALVLLATIHAAGQDTSARTIRASDLEWRRLGPTSVELGLASPGGGPVDRVWFSADGSRLYARVAVGDVFVTDDFENWTPAGRIDPPAPPKASPARLPESKSKVVEVALQRSRMYAAGQYAYRSDDAGLTWTNLTAVRSQSILGERLLDVAVSPANVDDVVVAGMTGVWRSLDGGISWTGLNDKLPNLPVKRLMQTVEGDVGVRIAIGATDEARWQPGQKTGWIPAPSADLRRELQLRSAAAATLRLDVTAVTRARDTLYAGTADGRLFVSVNNGDTWRPSQDPAIGAPVSRIAVDTAYGPYAVAITMAVQGPRVVRTVNGGSWWDDITANLPPGAVNGVALDRETGAVYIASEHGVFMTYTDTLAAGPAASWTLLRPGRAVDVLLDRGGNQLYAAFASTGIFAVMAPHRYRDPRVVSAADRRARAVAPGALLSVIGAKVNAAEAAGRTVPVLVSADAASEVQLPFDLPRDGVMLSFESARGRFQLGMPVRDAAPAIFVDGEGTPVVTNADTGLVLDSAGPARAGMRLQILAAGLGRVTPAWAPGVPAPLEDPPRVEATVRVYIDGEPVEVLRATLAPGYVGLYLVEVQLPSIVNRGPAELYIEAGGAISNRVRLYLDQQ
jgi:uncharacterized protein (TIGR03437 family)